MVSLLCFISQACATVPQIMGFFEVLVTHLPVKRSLLSCLLMYTPLVGIWAIFQNVTLCKIPSYNCCQFTLCEGSPISYSIYFLENLDMDIRRYRLRSISKKVFTSRFPLASQKIERTYFQRIQTWIFGDIVFGLSLGKTGHGDFPLASQKQTYVFIGLRKNVAPSLFAISSTF